MWLIRETVQHDRDVVRLAALFGVRTCETCRHAAVPVEGGGIDEAKCTRLIALNQTGAKQDARYTGMPFYFCSVERKETHYLCGTEGKLWKPA